MRLPVIVRHLSRHPLHAILNIAGLALALAAAGAILLVLRHEFSYEQIFTDPHRIVQVIATTEPPGRAVQQSEAVPVPLGKALAAAMPDLGTATRIVFGDQLKLQTTDGPREIIFARVEPNFFQLFDIPALHGDPSAALADPTRAVISASLARQLLGTEDAVGRPLPVTGPALLTVGAVIPDLPTTTHLDLSLVVPIAYAGGIDKFWPESDVWTDTFGSVYVRLADGLSVAEVDGRIRRWAETAVPSEVGAEGGTLTFGVRPITDIRRVPLAGVAFQGTGWPEIFSIVLLGLAILGIGCINYANLATAQATLRAREVGIRKVAGAGRAGLVAKFLAEGIAAAWVAFALAVGLLELGTPILAGLLQLPLDFSLPADLAFTVGLFGVATLLGLAAAAYPAGVMSGFTPTAALKGETAGSTGDGLRTILVALQFATAVLFIACVLVVHQQLDHARGLTRTFDPERTVLLGGFFPFSDTDIERLTTALAAIPGVHSVTVGGGLPGQGNGRRSVSQPATIETSEGPRTAEILLDQVGYGYLQTLGLRLVAGRDFDRARPADAPPPFRERIRPPAEDAVDRAPPAALINLAAVDAFGLGSADAATGRVIAWEARGRTQRVTVVGVVADFHQRSLHHRIAPTVFALETSIAVGAAVRLVTDDVPAALQAVDAAWAEVFPERTLRRFVMADGLAEAYGDERRSIALYGLAAGTAILIGCIGLFGLASFAAARRTKEIGIRKVLGATVADIVRLLTWQMSRPVLLGALVALPVAWIAMGRWLEGFAYRIELDPLPFLAAGAAALVVAWGTVGLHAVRVAQARPVLALRYE